MRTRKIGSLSVSAIGLGCMNVSFGYGPCDEATGERLFNEALDAGYTFLDTAFMYGGGHNETLLGKALSARRKEFVLATKCGLSPDGINGRPEKIKSECDISLKRLQTDVIDLYYLHRVDPDVPIEESVGAMSDLVAAGKVRELGLSEVSTETFKRARDTHSIAAMQSEYSLWSRTPERGMLQACLDSGTTFVPFSPLGRGFLGGSSKAVDELADNDLRATIARPRFEVDAFAKNQKLLVRFGEIAGEKNCSMAQLALAWLLVQANNTTVPIPGTKQIGFMKENIAASDIELDTDTVTELNALINEDTVIGERYTQDRMASTDSERD